MTIETMLSVKNTVTLQAFSIRNLTESLQPFSIYKIETVRLFLLRRMSNLVEGVWRNSLVNPWLLILDPEDKKWDNERGRIV